MEEDQICFEKKILCDPEKKFKSQYSELISINIEKQILQIVFSAVELAKNVMFYEESSLHRRFFFQDLSS